MSCVAHLRLLIPHFKTWKGQDDPELRHILTLKVRCVIAHKGNSLL